MSVSSSLSGACGPARVTGTEAEGTLSRRKLHYQPENAVDRSRALADFGTVEGTRSMHSVRGCGEAGWLWVRRFSCFCGACVSLDWDRCSTRAKIGRWDAATSTYNNDWKRVRIEQKAGAGVAATRQRATEKREAASADFGNDHINEGAWVAVDCGAAGDTNRMVFWLAQAKGGVYEAAADFNDGTTEIKEGDLVVDVQYYERVGPDNALEFYVEDTATVHLESVLCVSGLGVEEGEGGRGGGGGSRRRSARQAEGRSKPNVKLPLESSLRIMDEWKEKHPADAGRVL